VRIAMVVPGGVDRSGERRVVPSLLWLIERLAAGGGDQVTVFAMTQEARPGRWPLLGADIVNIGARPRLPRALLALAGEHRRAPFDIVHGFWAGGSGLAAAIFSACSGVPMVLSLAGSEITGLADIGYGNQLTLAGRVTARLAMMLADKLVVQSDWVARRAASFGAPTITIPYGVAIDRWAPSPPRRRTAEAPLRLLHVANLNPVKDQETLLMAMWALRELGVAFHLDIVGLDTMGGAIQRRCAELRLDDKVAFHGPMPHAAQRPWFESADLLVMSSRHEGGPLVMLEAALLGVPTVGTAVGHIADWAPRAAVAVPLQDPGALAGAIARVAADEEERLRLAAAARQEAEAHDADLTARRTRELYEEVRTVRGERCQPPGGRRRCAPRPIR